jgi:hypothetical protein
MKFRSRSTGLSNERTRLWKPSQLTVFGFSANHLPAPLLGVAEPLLDEVEEVDDDGIDDGDEEYVEDNKEEVHVEEDDDDYVEGR